MLGVYTDVETLTKGWLATTAVGPLVARGPGVYSIYLAMPAAAPLPAVVIRRVGGAPAPRSDLPVDVARISFSCWAASRAVAQQIAAAVVAACANLAETGGYATAAPPGTPAGPPGTPAGTARLLAAEPVGWLWLPDPDADVPRYIVDALITVVTAG